MWGIIENLDLYICTFIEIMVWGKSCIEAYMAIFG